VQQRLTIHVSRTARGEKKVACIVTRICECFACGVLLLYLAVPYSNEFKRAIDSAIL
jgi:hypothetical protein